MKAKYDAEVELHRRKAISYTVIRPGALTTEPAKGVTMGRTAVEKTRYVVLLIAFTKKEKKIAETAAENWSLRQSLL
jgi:hypothetical protein